MEEKQFEQGNYTVPQSVSVLRKANSICNLHDVLHKDPMTELCITEAVLRDVEKGKKLDGYVQEISYKPFSAILFSELSPTAVRENIKAGGGVFYFDATGTVVQKICEAREKLLFYTLVQPPVPGASDGSSSVPVCEFLLSRQNTQQISQSLDYFYNEMKKFSILSRPKRIVTDFSWAMIHSVLKVFNAITIQRYLEYCFKVSTGLRELSVSVTLLHLCAAHVVKAVRENVRDKILDKGLRQYAVRTFALIQNITNVGQCYDLFKTMCTVFDTKYETPVVAEQIRRLQKMVEKANLDDLSTDLVCDEVKYFRYFHKADFHGESIDFYDSSGAMRVGISHGMQMIHV